MSRMNQRGSYAPIGNRASAIGPSRTRRPDPPGAEPPTGSGMTREHRVREDRESVSLKQKRRVADERDHDVARHRDGRLLDGDGDLPGPAGSLGPKQSPELRDRLAVR